jgi:adenylylsulfate kinase
VRPSLFIGRWQPFHNGHKTLIETVLREGKNVVVACRDTPLSDSDPYTFEERRQMILDEMSQWGDRVQVILIPDIGEVVYGRQVGYDVRRLELHPEIEAISATAIREANLT